MTDRPDPPGEGHARASGGASSAAAGDAALLAALARGDHDALAALYEAWFGRALNLARAITRRDESFCLDVVQETFVRVIDHAPRLSRLATREDLDRWMGAVVRSAAVDLLRKDLRRTVREHTRTPRANADPEPVSVERAAWLREQIDALHPRDAELLSLRFGRGATLTGAARATGMTIGAAYGRIRRALARLTHSAREIDREP